jgi:hypothetical protein
MRNYIYIKFNLILKYLSNIGLIKKIERKFIMKDDPFYLSEEASLGVLLVDGNFERILSH